MFNFKSITILSVALLVGMAAGSASAKSDSYIDSLKALSFSQLEQNWDVDFEGDQIWFGGSILSILNTCMVNPTTIRSKYKYDIEVMDGDDFEVVGNDYLYKSIYSSRAVVDGDDVIDEPYIINTSRKIDIVTNDDDFENEFLFSRVFTTPNC